jgi:carbon storage regulator
VNARAFRAIRRTGEAPMLYLTRRAGEAVIINSTIEVRVVEVRGRSVKLGLTFPPGASVLREEVFLQVKRENEAALAAAQALIGGERDEPDETR